MGEVLFYHLTATPLGQSLAELLIRCLARDWRVVVRAGSAADLARLDEQLWAFDDASFLPHGTADMGHADRQPIYLTAGPENPAGASVLMLVEGARIDPAEAAAYQRVCLVFDGRDDAALQAARADWVAVRDAGVSGKYYSQETGRWAEKATTSA